MDAAIRWSPHATPDKPHFLIIDVISYRLRLCTATQLSPKQSSYSTLCVRDKLPNYTAFDWSKTNPNLVAIGAGSGEANVIQIDPERSGPNDEFIWSFPLKQQRKCNSIAFSPKNYLATGLERVRNDFCLYIFDVGAERGWRSGGSTAASVNLGSSQELGEPYKKLAFSEATVTSLKFFNREPDTLVAGVFRQCVRLYDLRDSSTSGSAQFPTKQVHNIAIDPLDENYFISAGPTGEPIVSVWDRRNIPRMGPQTPQDGSPAGSVLDIRPAVDNTQQAAIWGLRFSGTKRGCFGVLSSTGELRVIELAEHSAKSVTGMNGISNPYGGSTTWSSSKHYTRRSHQLKMPRNEGESKEQESQRVIAYDFVHNANDLQDTAIIGLHPSRKIQLFTVPEAPLKVNLTAYDELTILGRNSRIFRPTPCESVFGNGNTAEVDVHTTRKDSPLDSPSVMEQTSAESARTRKAVEQTLRLGQIHKRRCIDGYMLDIQRNQDIVQDNSILVELWSTIGRFQDLARHGGMRNNGLDLSYLGIADIWSATIAGQRHRTSAKTSLETDYIVDVVTSVIQSKGYPPYLGTKTKRPAQRQLCLVVCGWTFSKEKMQHRCRKLIEQGQYYKAIVTAVMRGFKDVALETLRGLIQQKTVPIIGLGAVIACETVNDEQRELCAWMQEEASDPYLKALLSYFVSSDWRSVTEMASISLADRVGIAMRYLDDERLDSFISRQITHATAVGNVEGILLTGLTDRALDLLQRYIAASSDLQTAVLALSFAFPLYSSSDKFRAWHQTYLQQMQVWRAFSERENYLEVHRRLSVHPETKATLSVESQRAHPQPALACNFCHKSFGYRRLQPSQDGSDVIVTVSVPRKPFSHSPAAHSGLLCQQCGHIMPACGICGNLVGQPDPKRLGPAAAAKLAGDEHGEGSDNLTMYCFSCQHCFHAGHAKEWFSRHRACPVPGCTCLCGLLH